MRVSYRCALLGLLVAIGVLALLFSAVSPNDDDIQQEFVQGAKPKQRLLADYKATREVRTLVRSTGSPVLSAQMRTSIGRAVVGAVLIVAEKVPGKIISSRTGNRSPPSKSS